jgi:ElaB/YqjD/DUF883 family membrane-anchored ribosome-binding protein
MASTVQSKRDDIAMHASEIGKDFQDMGQAARQMAAERAEQLRETANEYLDQGKARVREFGETMQHQIQEQPMKTLLIAGAVGFVLGMLWNRR